MSVIGEIFNILGTNANIIAEEMGITRMTVYDWVHGRRKVPKGRVSHLSEILQVPQSLLTKESELNKSEKILLLGIYAKSILGEEVSVQVKN